MKGRARETRGHNPKSTTILHDVSDKFAVGSSSSDYLYAYAACCYARPVTEELAIARPHQEVA